MSVLEEIRKLDEQKNKLIESAKKQALRKVDAALMELSELGFNYQLVEKGSAPTTTSKRRSGMRQQVLDLIKGKPHGIARADLIEAMEAKGDKSAEQSISNALSALKKQGTITSADGQYKVVGT